MTVTSHEAIRRAIEERATERGRRVREVVIKSGHSPDLLNKRRKLGITLSILEDIAAELDWTIFDLLAAAGAPGKPPQVAERHEVRHVRDRLALIASVASRLHLLLGEVEPLAKAVLDLSETSGIQKRG